MFIITAERAIDRAGKPGPNGFDPNAGEGWL